MLIGAGQKVQTGFIDFFMTQAQEGFSEKVQIDQFLGDNYVAWVFGQEPPVFNYSGNLLNSEQDDQRIGFALAYQQLLRGTSLARRGALARLRYDSVIVSGIGIATSQVLNAENELIVPFTFQFLVKEYVVLQQPRYRKTSQADFVALATAFAPDLLSKIGQASDARIRTTMILPPALAQSSVAGSEENITVVDTSKPAPQQLADKAAQSTAPAPATTNIFGTITPAPSSPPPPQASGL